MTSSGRKAAANASLLTRVVEEHAYQSFGFVVFRMTFGDESRWSRFIEEYQKILEKDIDEASGESAAAAVCEKLSMNIVDDEILDGAGPLGAASAFQMLKEEGEIEAGLDTKMCLYADAECVASVLDAGGQDEPVPPFLKAVDVNAASTVDKGAQVPHQASKVAIESLVLAFYPTLHEATDLAELGWEPGSVWTGK